MQSVKTYQTLWNILRSTTSELHRTDLFEYQLERNSFTSTPFELILIASTDTAGADILASLGWQETTR